MSTHPPTLTKPRITATTIEHDALPAGTRFGEFEILRVLGVGGFGIVYLARDHSLERDVALKEYMPASLAARGAGPQITVRSSSFAETYAIGLRSFINEARLLARFDHPSLVKVYRFWEDNATAYMVMPYLQGTTLRDMRRGISHSPDELWIRSVVMPILSALELLHREGVYHRDIAPDNILLPPDGPPVLLDFGAARRVISDRTQSLTAILKPSYAPIEQYAEMTQLRQGPWTDLYALGAVIHYLLFGVPPAPATARAVQDDVDAIERRIVPGVSSRFMEAMSWMLAIRPNARPQSCEQLRAVLDGSAEVPLRGRPGITLPGELGRAAAETAPTQLHVRSADTTGVQTAFLPTYMPTTLDTSHGEKKTTTSFSPVTQMPTARQSPIVPSASVGTREPEPARSSPAVTATVPMPVTATVPMPHLSQPAATPAVATAPTPSPKSAPPAAAAPASPRPVAAAPEIPVVLSPMAPVSTLPRARSKAGLAALAAGGIAVVAIAFAGWQYAVRKDGAASVDAASPAAAGPAMPTTANSQATAPAVVGDPNATLPPIAAARTGQSTAPATATVPLVEGTTTGWAGSQTSAQPMATQPTTAPPIARAPAPPSPSATVAAGMAASLLNGTTRNAPSMDGSLRSPTTPRTGGVSGTEIYLDRGAPIDGSRPRPTTRPGAADDRLAPSTTLRPVDRASMAITPGLGDGRGSLRPGGSARDIVTAPRAEIVDEAPMSARAACGSRGFFGMAVCMDAKCEEPRYRATQECMSVLARKAERANR